MVPGDLFVMMDGTTMMPMWLAGSLVSNSRFFYLLCCDLFILCRFNIESLNLVFIKPSLKPWSGLLSILSHSYQARPYFLTECK